MTRYSLGAIVLHWLIAFALAFELALGFAMPRGVEGFALFQLHKSVGISILALTILRLGWRLAHPRPAPLESGWAHRMAHAVHVGFYLFMLLAPLTGWALVSTAPIKVPTLLFGTLPLPHLPLADSFNPAVEEAHELLAWFGIALFLLHVAGAVRHEILLRDRLLERMAPGGSRPLGAVLALGVIALGLGAFLSIGGAKPGGEPDSVALAPVAPSPAAQEAADTLPAAEETSPAATESSAPVPIWAISPGGRLTFKLGNGDAGVIEGSFGKWQGAIAFDPERPETADIRITIDLASASVGDSTQDGMLAGDEFFAVSRFSKAVFTAKSARKTGGDRYTASGTLQLKGTSRPQTISFRLTGSGLARKVQGSATVARAAFGVGEGAAAESLDPNVSVNFSFDARGTVPAE
ncbi:cytochrome b/b6 domain-containing protein [Altererythrobacter sp. CC-YST694]|uniref:cytochrome b/b6 domain-containing protein n=1 Tax=Altererythrobacter sp. CC-YST694 TaxID=2755038 RepID=UPI001D0237D1|nr:cytochrome b/b6 domain-containing protein [Altererythrobacter sp. CC-YST694]MCB5426478.1 cytochrome b/b6 domain-containing protein [Altererythrobacter sp. CC-YST694]